MGMCSCRWTPSTAVTLSSMRGSCRLWRHIKSAVTQTSRLLTASLLSRLCLKTNRQLSELVKPSQRSKPPSTAPASLSPQTAHPFIHSTALLPRPPRLSIARHHRRLLSHHHMRSPWQSLTSAIPSLFPTLLRTPLQLWSLSPREQCGQLFPLALTHSVLGNQPRSSGGLSPLPHHRPALEQPLPSHVPCTSIARRSLDPPLQGKVNSLFYVHAVVELSQIASLRLQSLSKILSKINQRLNQWSLLTCIVDKDRKGDISHGLPLPPGTV